MLALAIAGAASLAGARADDARVGFTTYLREGPGTEYRTTDEAQSGWTVAVLDCRSGWCRIRFGDRVGWVAEGTLETGAPPRLSGPQSCFVNGESGYHGTREVRVCGAETARP